ncbi:MAG: hypothetical protein HY235_23370 [Acidobacteria bacterium]|nr:hypothetical protein [Acidobacteriota bacterium]
MLHRKPLLGNFQIQIGIGQSSCFQALSKVGRTLGLYEMQYSPIDESAAIAPGGNPAENGGRGIRKNDVDTFAHRIFYTLSVWISNVLLSTIMGIQFLNVQPIVLDLRDFVPVEPSRIADRLPKHWLLSLAIRHNIQPVAVPAIRRDTAFCATTRSGQWRTVFVSSCKLIDAQGPSRPVPDVENLDHLGSVVD